MSNINDSLCILLKNGVFSLRINLFGLKPRWSIPNNNNGHFYSALPIKTFTAQGAYKSDTNNNNITHSRTHTHTHTHTHSHTSSFKNYMPPKYTCQKAENQIIGASFALSLSLPLSLPLPTRSHTGAGHMQFYRRKSRVSS